MSSGMVNGRQIAPGNIDLHHRPVVKNRDGSISTVRSISVTDDRGRTFLIPTVSPDGRILKDRDAINLFRKTGQHLGVFSTPGAADRYAVILHNSQAQEYLPQELARQRVAPAKPRLSGGRGFRLAL